MDRGKNRMSIVEFEYLLSLHPVDDYYNPFGPRGDTILKKIQLRGSSINNIDGRISNIIIKDRPVIKSRRNLMPLFDSVIDPPPIDSHV